MPALPRRLSANEIPGADMYNALRDYVEASTPLPSADVLVRRMSSGSTFALAYKPNVVDPPFTLYYGKPVTPFTGGATMTLDPCDAGGTDSGDDNVTVYVKSNKTSYTMLTDTSIGTSVVIPYVKDAEDYYYVLGTPKIVVTDITWSLGQGLLVKQRDDWGLFFGSETEATALFVPASITVQTDFNITPSDFSFYKTRRTNVVVISADDEASELEHTGTGCPDTISGGGYTT